MTDQRLDFVSATDTSAGVRGRLAYWHERLRARRKTWMAIRGLREIVLILGTYSLYDVTRYLVAGDHDGAISNGQAIFSFEQRWHIDPEHWLNNAVSPHVLLAVPSDYIYAVLHYLVTPIVLIWLWRRHASHYGSARTVLLFTTVIGLVCFSLYPVAPPRLLGGFIDTMAKYSNYGWWGKAASAPRGFGHDTNQYAAMPSLHVGWALWSGWQLLKYGKHRITRYLGAVYPFVLSAVVIATGNHYFLDVVAGFVVVLLGAALATVFNRLTWWANLSPPTGIEDSPPVRST